MTLILGDNKGYFHAIFKSAFTVLGSGKEYIEYKIYKYHYKIKVMFHYITYLHINAK